jgi:AIG2 family protein
MKYFAYGSNMSLSRFRERVPSAERLGLFILEQHVLRFHKISDDGSGKCDAFQTENSDDSVIGSLFLMDPCEKPALDKVEGLGGGYEEKLVNVKNDVGEVVEAVTYYATRIDSALKPYSWYLNHVIVGAKEIEVPTHYLNDILSIKSIKDEDTIRDAEQRAIHE